MNREIKASGFADGEQIYVFEYGEGKFIDNQGFDSEAGDEILRVEINGELLQILSTQCFAYGPNDELFRVYRLGNATVKITYNPIKLIYQGPEVWVRYSNEEGDRELFEDGDSLHKDWDGNGIEFDVLVEKWLHRLNGETIPLSDYYKDPYNRWLDSLGE